MKTETKLYNPFDHLLDEADMGEYLTQAFMDEDPSLFVTALGHVVMHRGGVAKLAEEIGLNRESLYKTLSGKVKPKWETVQKIVKALKLQVRLAA